MENKITHSLGDYQRYLRENMLPKQEVAGIRVQIKNNGTRLKELTQKINDLVDYGRALLENKEQRYENNRPHTNH